MIEMQISAIALDKTSGQPIVVLLDSERGRVLPIWVGVPEAMAISLAAQNMKSSRPLTHTLMSSVIEQLDYKVNRVLITAVKAGVFMAEIELLSKGENSARPIITIDSRPSDALALATICEIPVLVAPHILEEAGVSVSDIEQLSLADSMMVQRKTSKRLPREERERADFRKFVDTVKASDFKLPDSGEVIEPFEEGGEDRINE